MNNDTPVFRTTPYGDVSADALAVLQRNFDTTTLLRLVDHVDALRPRFTELGIRDDLLRLHAMAHTVINDGALIVAPDDTDLWEMAQALIDEFSDTITILRTAIERLQPLSDLAPE